MSRPPKPIDWELVDKLLISGCLGTEIAGHFDMHHDTFYRRIEENYGVSFTAYQQEKRMKGDGLLRAKQFEKAMKGDNSMLIWLGKNRLGQKDSEERNQPIFFIKRTEIEQTNSNNMELPTEELPEGT